MAPDTARKGSTWQDRVFRSLQALEQARGKRVPQEELAELVSRQLRQVGRSASQTTVGRWLRGEVIPDLDAIAALAHVLGVSPGWLAFGEGEPPTLLYPPTAPAGISGPSNGKKRQSK